MLTSEQINKVASHIAEESPALWARVCPRMYGELKDRYLPYRAVPALLLGNWLGIRRLVRNGMGKDVDGSMQSAAVIMAELRRLSMPVYYISPALLEAVMHSDLPADIIWDDIRLPMKAATFMLPLGVFKHPIEGSIGFISYAGIEDGEAIFEGDDVLHIIHAVKKSFTAITCCFEAQDREPMYHAVIQTGSHVRSGDLESNLHKEQHDTGFFSMPMEQQDEAFNASVVNLVFRIILAMQARPELLSRGVRTGKRLKSGTEIWTPNIVGRNYATKREGRTEGGGWSVRMHWRRGHFRQQPYGPREKPEYKTIWLQPVLVGE